MSPTSYQAAPPRTSTIADAHHSVKLEHAAHKSLEEFSRAYKEESYHSLYGVPFEEGPVAFE